MILSLKAVARLRRMRRQAWTLIALSLILQGALALQAGSPSSGALHAAPLSASETRR